MKKSEKEYVLQAQQLRRDGKYSEAESVLKGGLAAYPSSMSLFIENASLAMDRQNFKEAVCIWKDLISKFQERAPIGVYVRMSVAHRKLGDIDKSKEIIELLSRNNNMNFNANIEGAIIALIQQKWDTALDYYNNAKEFALSDDDKIQVDINIASVLIQAKRFEMARSYIETLLKQYTSFVKNQKIRAILAKLCREENIKKINDGWITYWESRKEFVYIHICKQIMQTIGYSASSTTIIDVGSNRTPILEFLPNVKNRYSIDPTAPYQANGVISVYEDFLQWEPPSSKIQFGTCLQVMEHVPNPTGFARKLLEVCEVILISVPYLENPGVNPGHIHSMIDLKTIENWFGKSPNYHYIAIEMSGDKRIICLFDNKTDQKYPNFNKDSSTSLLFKFRWSLDGSGITSC